MEYFCIVKAKEMMGLEEAQSLPNELHGTLLELNNLCINAGGELRSRQVIATIVLQWQLENK